MILSARMRVDGGSNEVKIDNTVLSIPVNFFGGFEAKNPNGGGISRINFLGTYPIEILSIAIAPPYGLIATGISIVDVVFVNVDNQNFSYYTPFAPIELSIGEKIRLNGGMSEPSGTVSADVSMIGVPDSENGKIGFLECIIKISVDERGIVWA